MKKNDELLKEKITEIINVCQKINRCDLDIKYDEPMSAHTSFKVGGPASCFITPAEKGFACFTASLFRCARDSGIRLFVLGGGANIVVADKGIAGIVLDTTGFKGAYSHEEKLFFRSGTTMDEAADYAANASLSGLEFLAGMPGTLGGAIYMNARCYGSEIADVLSKTEIIDYTDKNETNIRLLMTNKSEFGYKTSPFQGKDIFILSASFNLKPGNKNEIQAKMEQYRKDRKEKGHYLFPSAGSAFKNNHEFGKPTGQIIDELGLKGFSVGGAQIAPFHGNIVINTGNATAQDIRTLMLEVTSKVKKATGFTLEPEIIFVAE